MDEKYLPIGTVVILKKGKKRLMITGYSQVDLNNKEKVYDYCGCFYPEGMLDDSKFLFNHDQIEKVFYKGLIDEEQEKFIVKLKDIIAKK